MSIKAVLMSAKPEWCKKILSREKTVEVRKTRPKLETPFKVYIYCTKTAEGWLRAVPVQGWQRLDGFVIGEFTCYKIDTIRRMGIDDNFDYCYLSLNEFGNDDIAIEIQDVKKSCIPKYELNAYGKSAQELFAWHISDQKIYDEPLPLSNFTPNCRHLEDEAGCRAYREHGWSCPDQRYDHQPDGSVNMAICQRSVKRAPQSWCYVEEKDIVDLLYGNGREKKTNV